MHNSAQSGLALDNSVRDAHLSAQSGKVDNQLDWINIIRNKDKRSLLVLDKTDNVVQTVLDGVWFLADVFLLLTLGDSGCLGLKSVLLLSLGLWSVFV